MNPLHIALEWGSNLAKSLRWRCQGEIAETEAEAIVYIVIGGPGNRNEVLRFSRARDAWWPVTVGDDVIADAGEFRVRLGSIRCEFMQWAKENQSE